MNRREIGIALGAAIAVGLTAAAGKLLFVEVVFAQSRPPALASQAFEAASVKKSDADFAKVSLRVTAAGVSFRNASLAQCIEKAFGLQRYQVSGPDWIRTERYMIEAKAGGATARGQLMVMLQTLLQDRFHLVVHREAKSFPVYMLMAEGDHHGLRPSQEPEGGPDVGIGSSGGAWSFKRQSLGALAEFLSGPLIALDRPVLDRTGIGGEFDFTLKFAHQDNSFRAETDPGQTVPEPDVFAAIKKQLGIGVKATTAPIEILVVDHAERSPVVD